MKTKTATEANILMWDIMESFVQMSRSKVSRASAVVENVALSDIQNLFNGIDPNLRKLYMPGEMGNECIIIMYYVAPGFTICIESEPCVKLIPKINLINYN